MDVLEKIMRAAGLSGMCQANFIPTKDLTFYPEIRKICEGNACRNYARTWACPPATGTLEECQKRLLKYDTLLLFSNKYEIEDCFDIEGMRAALLAFKRSVDLFHNGLNAFLSDFLLLSNEGCARCEKCTYPGAPCRFPGLLHHSIEGYALNIGELANLAGIRYNNGPNTVTYFGGLAFHAAARARRD